MQVEKILKKFNLILEIAVETILFYSLITMKANIIAENRIIYQGEVSLITLPGIKGELTVLPNHLPLITSLTKGKIKVKEPSGKELFFEIEKGLLEVQPDEVNALVSCKLI